jgi:hypothetical protein
MAERRAVASSTILPFDWTAAGEMAERRLPSIDWTAAGEMAERRLPYIDWTAAGEMVGRRAVASSIIIPSIDRTAAGNIAETERRAVAFSLPSRRIRCWSQENRRTNKERSRSHALGVRRARLESPTYSRNDLDIVIFFDQ